MTTIQITLPDQLVQEAQRAGLLSPALLERWLRSLGEYQQIHKVLNAVPAPAGR